MPRWPAGLHTAAGALPAVGGYRPRVQATGQIDYWRHQDAELHAACGPVTVPASGQAQAMTGPAGTGEVWYVTEAQVQTSSQVALPPLVVQQVRAQQAGQTVTPPPPITAQVWRAVAGQNERILMTTSQGGNDNLGVTARLSPGEQVAVVWYGAAPGDQAWAIVKGTKLVLGT